MENYIIQNKSAWEYDAYNFWIQEAGLPSERAEKIKENPIKHLKRYAKYFDSYEGKKIANICGSCGKKAVPLAVLGAEVTIFDISKENKKYALELAECAGVPLEYVLGNVLEIDRNKYQNYFDVVFMEGGILHYFHDINKFMEMMYLLLKKDGRMICSDFHPFTKIQDSLQYESPIMSYFSTELYEAEMAHARFYEEEIRKNMPKCSLRKYTMSEIVNAVIENGFILRKLEEHPSWKNEDLPGEFTIIANK